MTRFDPLVIPLDAAQMIEASAGTGKTYTITNLCLRLLLGRNLPWNKPLSINQILILTFTIAATDELKDRIGKRIDDARQAFRQGDPDDDFLRQLVTESTDPSRDLKLLTAASQLIDDASIFTIHGFCARVLGEQAFESGSLFNTELNAERDHLLQIAAEDCFRQFVLPLDDAVRPLALAMWASPSQLAGGLTPYLFRGELHFYPPFNPALDAEEIATLVREIKRRWLDEDLTGYLQAADLKGRSIPLNKLGQMEAFCRGDELESELWEVYGSAGLAARTRKNGDPPQHPVLDLVDQVPAYLTQLKANLWHEARRRVLLSLGEFRDHRNLLTVDDLLTRLAEAVNREDSTLPETLRARWPVAMIDEFQDTDNIQSSIFTPVYLGEETGADATLLMIGDPKQAIYGFRGADIYTYINARRETGEQHNLAVNWRSSPAMVRATNALFAQDGIFGTVTDVEFTPVSASDSHAGMHMSSGGRELAPYQVFVHESADTFTPVAEALDILMGHAADETAAILNDPTGTLVDGKPVRAGQVAFLVRRQKDALAARQALAARGIRSVYLTLESVFLQDTASDLKLILEAIIEPGNDFAIRSALATRLMQTPAADIDQLNTDITLQQEVTAEFRHYHDQWREKDIAHMLSSLLEKRQLADKWLNRPEGERQLTNFRHLSELLQQQSAVTPGMHQLVKWLGREQRNADSVSAEERQLRLESDENLVKIVTMHAAKGLEYDIVMIPMPVFSQRPGRAPYLFHEQENGSYHAAASLSEDPAYKSAWKAEEESEEMRLLYVALTRARYRCYLGLPKTRDLATSAIARLLGLQDTDRNAVIMHELDFGPDENLFEVVTADAGRMTTFLPTSGSEVISRPPGKPPLYSNWQIHSYSGVTARLATSQQARQARADVSGFSDDDEQADTAPQSSTRTRHSFPRGARVGIALHSLLEDTDFAEPSTVLCERTVRRLGLEEDWVPVLGNWLSDILAAPMADFSLKDIPMHDRLDEMEFHFTLSSAPELGGFLQEHGYIHAAPHTLDLKGQMTGLIDMLFRRDGRYYIVDYKSNHLGWGADAYEPDRLTGAMAQHQYHLQYLIYTVAVHRMLKHRIPGYSYDVHMGGVFYLFLRGMQPGSTRGIFTARPALSTIEKLDSLLLETGR